MEARDRDKTFCRGLISLTPESRFGERRGTLYTATPRRAMWHCHSLTSPRCAELLAVAGQTSWTSYRRDPVNQASPGRQAGRLLEGYRPLHVHVSGADRRNSQLGCWVVGQNGL